MRDLKADLEICNKATPGPWECLDDTPVDPEWANIFPQDLDFVMEAREGWPHAIERAIAAEAEVAWLREECNSYNTTLGETISECAANMQEKEQENERLRLYVKSITGGLDEAIETNQYLEKIIDGLKGDLQMVATDEWTEGFLFEKWKTLAELDKEGEK